MLTLPEHLSSPTDFDHHLQTLLVNCRRRSHLILYLDDERNCGVFVFKELYFMLVEQELLTLPEQLSSPTDFDHHLQTLLVNSRRRSHLILYLDDERNCVLFVLKELYFMLVEQELLTLPKHLHSPR